MGFSANKSKQTSVNQAQSNSTSESFNQAYPFLMDTFAPQTANTGLATNAISSLLGLNGETGQNAAFDNFRNSSGYNFMQNEGIRGIEASQASKGLLGSGATLRALQDRSSNLSKSFLDSYLSNLGALSNTGLQAGQIIGSAGNTSSSDSKSTSSGSSNGSSFGFSITGKR